MGASANDRKAAAKYVDLTFKGAKPRDAARAVGYSDGVTISNIERPGGPVALAQSAMVTALKNRGITEEWVANEYEKGIALSQSPGAANADCNAHGKYLLQLGYLLGYGRNGPAVAVQINNSPAQGDKGYGDERVEDTLREVRDLLTVVREELGSRNSAPVSGEGDSVAGGDPVPPAPEAHPGMDDLVREL